MLSLLPDIFFLSHLSPTLLRIAAGLVLLSLAWTHYERREELSRVDFLVVGRGAWIPMFASLVELAIGIGLIVGIYTQAFAILGALAALKAYVWKRRYSALFPISRTASALLFVICLSLLVTGPGAFAFDLPL